MSSPTSSPSHLFLKTTHGLIVIELYFKHAPLSTKNLAELAIQNYFSHTPVKRIVQGAFIQLGAPANSNGTSSNGEFYTEVPSKALYHSGAGVVSMCQNRKGFIGSQFVISLAPLSYLDGKQVIVGRVCKGMSVVQHIGAAVKVNGEKPAEHVEIEKAWVERKAA
eukprot:CAMPEP_0117447668 /NCGR_PEP_ID=MMETSP0759-20121206/6997_1 /TAXON_ID=63605 /ORGANISM="Percolomonas cosmopolitus, Strain WS" /LENGTH=164 /DNA_ID=CAMNT_0005240017 /DNA_START=253 /DNA_END=747 /DNA_ORIENTATION=+